LREIRKTGLENRLGFVADMPRDTLASFIDPARDGERVVGEHTLVGAADDTFTIHGDLKKHDRVAFLLLRKREDTQRQPLLGRFGHGAHLWLLGRGRRLTRRCGRGQRGRWLFDIHREIDHRLRILLGGNRLIVDIDCVVLVNDVHAVIDVDGFRCDQVHESCRGSKGSGRPPPPWICGVVADPADAPSPRSPPTIIEDIVVEIAGVVPNLLGTITAILPQVFSMLLSVLSIVVAPCLAVFAGAFEIIPALVAILLKVIARLLPLVGSLVPCVVAAAIRSYASLTQ
jgi:hypothetical protein